MTDQPPSLTRLESAVFSNKHDAALHELKAILGKLNRTNGVLENFEIGAPFAEGGRRELHVHFATRFAAAFAALVARPDAALDPVTVEALFIFHRWRDMMVSVSGFQTGTYLIPHLPRDEEGRLILAGDGIIKFLLIFSPSSDVTISFDECASHNGLATLLALVGYLASRTCVSKNAVDLRERILEWLPGKMGGLNFGSLQLAFAADTYMHCSYAFSPKKHRIKRDLIEQMRGALLAHGARELVDAPPPRARPKIVVVCEHFHSQHSVYRTHSRAVRALKERFEVIGIGDAERIDAPARECFHELMGYSEADLISSASSAAEAILNHRPDIVFFLGVGMSNHAIALASLRLAPIQCVSYGHTATTMSPVMDYMILPDDFVGASDVYSETLLRLPPEAIPYSAPHPDEPSAPPMIEPLDDGRIRIAVPASIMKINARFLEALKRASDAAKAPVEFHFFPLGAVGLAYFHLEREVTKIIPGAVVHEQAERQTYLQRLGLCDFFVSPFPYGNMNSIVDAMVMGIPGVCLDGAEAHAHADVAIFRRLGLPGELCATDVESYISAITRLIDDSKWLRQCRNIAAAVDLDTTMYRGDERLFCAEMVKLLENSSATVRGSAHRIGYSQ